jgi:hypothetical protein
MQKSAKIADYTPFPAESAQQTRIVRFNLGNKIASVTEVDGQVHVELNVRFDQEVTQNFGNLVQAFGKNVSRESMELFERGLEHLLTRIEVMDALTSELVA